MLETSLGRVLFNEIFPEEFPFQNEAMTKKKLQKVMALVYQTLGQEKTAEVADELKNLAFYYATLSGTYQWEWMILWQSMDLKEL